MIFFLSFRGSRPGHLRELQTWDSYPLPVLRFLLDCNGKGNNIFCDASMIYKNGAEPGGPPSVTPLSDEGLPPVTQEKSSTLISFKIKKTPRPLKFLEFHPG
jgi:hypothetical protein